MIKVVLFDWYGVLDSFESKAVFDIAFKLKERGLKIGILSNMSKSRKLYYVNVMKMDETFDYFFTSGEIGYYKPDKEIYVKVLEKLSIEPFECVFIDDATINVDAAKHCAMVGIYYEGPEKLVEALERLGINME